MIKRILFVADFTPDMVPALAYARELAVKFSAPLTLMNVIDNPTSKRYGSVAGDFYAQEENARRKTLEWLDQLSREQLNGVPNCECTTEIGGLLDRVLETVAKRKIDLIVVSARSHEGFHLHLRAELGEKLAYQAPCHVLVVHTRPQAGAVERQSA